MSTKTDIASVRAKAESGDAYAQRQLGWCYQSGDGAPKDMAEALKWYRQSAAQGNSWAQNDVGRFYEYGWVVPQDYAEAMKWYLLSAQQGVKYAQHNLACLYYSGHGTPLNYADAAKWFTKAAEQKHSTAAYFLGWLCCTGNGVEKSYASALFWYRQAAADGVAGAQLNLAIMIENGQGVSANTEEAVKWYRKAAAQDNENAKKALERLKVPLEEPEPAPAHRNHIREPRAKPAEPSDCKPLLAACTPQVYIHNAFRITGLPVDASTRDIKRRVDDLKAAAEMGDDEDEHTHAFALSPPPEVDHIREAAQRLHDPERRMVEELFWFWPQEPGQGRSDRALRALQSGDKDAAFKLWSAAARDHDEAACIVAKHNLAVMYQMVALDSEILALTGSFSDDQLATVSKYWTTCFQWWEELTDDETFWSLIADRIRTLDDHRLTTGFARRMRASFPIAFDQINAMLALQYAEKGKYDHAKRHIAYMKETHQGADDVDRVISEILKPLETRVNNAVETAVTRSKRDVTKGAEIAKELLDATKNPLAIIRSLLDQDHTIRSYLFELVHDACTTCLIAYGNKTEDWPTCVSLLKLTEPLVTSEDARNKLRTNIAQAEKNQREKELYETCWFCKRNPAEDANVLEVPMHGNVLHHREFTGTRVTWRTLAAKVPRCASCKEAHSKVAGKWTGAAAGAAIGTAVMPVIGSAIGFFAGKALGRLVDQKMRLPDGVQAESAKSTYPPIQKLINEGWAFGEKPST